MIFILRNRIIQVRRDSVTAIGLKNKENIMSTATPVVTKPVGGKLTLTPQAPSYGGAGWVAGDPPAPPAIVIPNPATVPEVNGVIQTQLPYPPYVGSNLSNAIR